MWAHETKVKILVAIWASLPVVAEEVVLLCITVVPNLDGPIIMGATTSSPGEPGTSTGDITPQGCSIIGGLALSFHQITPDLLHSLALPVNHLLASDWDSACDTKTESNSFNGSGRETGEICSHPQMSSGCEPDLSLRVAYRGLVPMTKLFTSQLPIAEVD